MHLYGSYQRRQKNIFGWMEWIVMENLALRSCENCAKRGYPSQSTPSNQIYFFAFSDDRTDASIDRLLLQPHRNGLLLLRLSLDQNFLRNSFNAFLNVLLSSTVIDDSGPHTLFTIHNGGAEYNLHIVETKMQDIKMYVRINTYDG